MTPPSPQQYISDSDVLFSEAEVLQATALLANEINIDFEGEAPIVLSVMTGAIVFTGHLVTRLTFPLELGYVHATRYEAGVEGKSLLWISKPSLTLKDRNVLILDDILDEGITLKSIVDECSRLGAKNIKVAVLVEKELSKSKPIQADYVGFRVPNRYVFGCGMDVYGWWRNLPAIHALKIT